MMCTASAATSAVVTTRRMGSGGAKLIAAVVELIAEERCRQRCIDEARSDKVNPDGSEFERKAGRESGERSAVTVDIDPHSGAHAWRPPVPPMNSRVPLDLTLWAALRAT